MGTEFVDRPERTKSDDAYALLRETVDNGKAIAVGTSSLRAALSTRAKREGFAFHQKKTGDAWSCWLTK